MRIHWAGACTRRFPRRRFAPGVRHGAGSEALPQLDSRHVGGRAARLGRLSGRALRQPARGARVDDEPGRGRVDRRPGAPGEGLQDRPLRRRAGHPDPRGRGRLPRLLRHLHASRLHRRVPQGGARIWCNCHNGAVRPERPQRGGAAAAAARRRSRCTVVARAGPGRRRSSSTRAEPWAAVADEPRAGSRSGCRSRRSRRIAAAQDGARPPLLGLLLPRRHDAVLLPGAGRHRHPADALLPAVRRRGLRVGRVHHDHGRRSAG